MCGMPCSVRRMVAEYAGAASAGPVVVATTAVRGRRAALAATATSRDRSMPHQRRGGGSGYAGLQVEAGRLVADPLGGDGVDVALAHQHVDLAGHLDLGLVVGVEEHPVPGLDGTGVRPDGNHARPGEPARAHRRGGRDDDAAGRPALPGLLVELDQDPVVQQLDRGLVGNHGCEPAHGGQDATLRTSMNSAATPTTPPATLRMLSVRGCPVCTSTKYAFTADTSRWTIVFG